MSTFGVTGLLYGENYCYPRKIHPCFDEINRYNKNRIEK